MQIVGNAASRLKSFSPDLCGEVAKFDKISHFKEFLLIPMYILFILHPIYYNVANSRFIYFKSNLLHSGKQSFY